MTWTDEELVARSISGDADSFNELVLRWERPIYALAYRVIGREEDARDVCQETFLRAFRALPGFKGQAKFSSWLYRIALNLCRDWIRRQRRAPVMQMPEGVDPGELMAERGPVESIEELVARRQLSSVVEVAMALLPEEQRTAIILKEYHGMTFQEIADVHAAGCPPWIPNRVRGTVECLASAAVALVAEADACLGAGGGGRADFRDGSDAWRLAWRHGSRRVRAATSDRDNACGKHQHGH